jgi:hypothetical protein
MGILILRRSSKRVLASCFPAASSTVFNPADSKPYGLTYPQWAAKFYQWGLSIPLQASPFNDDTGKNCAQNQQGPVWFLGGTGGGVATRSCTVPAGKANLIEPIFSGCSYAEHPTFKIDSQLFSCTKADMSTVKTVEASIDGVNIPNLDKYLVQSSVINLTLAENNIVGAPAGPSKGTVENYFIIIEPLSAGKHDISFKGLSVDYTSTSTQNFINGVTYHLTVR